MSDDKHAMGLEVNVNRTDLVLLTPADWVRAAQQFEHLEATRPDLGLGFEPYVTHGPSQSGARVWARVGGSSSNVSAVRHPRLGFGWIDTGVAMPRIWPDPLQALVDAARADVERARTQWQDAKSLLQAILR